MTERGRNGRGRGIVRPVTKYTSRSQGVLVDQGPTRGFRLEYTHSLFPHGSSQARWDCEKRLGTPTKPIGTRSCARPVRLPRSNLGPRRRIIDTLDLLLLTRTKEWIFYHFCYGRSEDPPTFLCYVYFVSRLTDGVSLTVHHNNNSPRIL